MDMLLWVVAVVAAASFLLAGSLKLALPHARLTADPKMGWARDFSASQVKLIGLLEVLGAIGLVLPPWVGIAEGLVPLAAAGLCLDMVGAFSTHVRRGDPIASRVPPLVLGALMFVLAVGRYWVEPF